MDVHAGGHDHGAGPLKRYILYVYQKRPEEFTYLKLVMADGGQMEPAFDERIFNYRIWTMHDQPTVRGRRTPGPVRARCQNAGRAMRTVDKSRRRALRARPGNRVARSIISLTLQPE